MTITHVCLSDLHFGAESSLFTELDANGQPQYQRASPVLDALVECLQELLAQQQGAPRPTLVLAGDVLELALAETNQAAMTFEAFLTRLFRGGEGNLFSPEIIVVPGNHDHHLWEIARETNYLDYLRKIPAGQPLGEEWHVTRLYRRDGVGWPEQRLLTGIATRHPQLTDLRMATAYPNMGIRSADGKRSVVITHGHYVEPLYSLMSHVKSMLFPEQGKPESLIQLEQENFAWIDFFWSAMGRSGAAGQDVQRVYEMIGTEAGRRSLSSRMASGIVEQFLAKNWIPDLIERPAIEVLIRGLFASAEQRERGQVNQALSEDARKGLQQYIGGPLWRQLNRECRDASPPESVTVVFGHTHKPFEATETIHGYVAPVDILNTGGWVVDTVERQPLHGGAIVVVDENCNCASLRMYNETRDGQPASAVRVAATRPSALTEALQPRVAAGGVWKRFAEVAHTGVTIRADALRRRSR